ncbi:MAG: radical SAM protein [Methanobrevibacter sp.]|jgi:radical SAM protein with 4Fe4S-binding SPASM domain|nr:radical SAM protein [Methanobrevibacter sp.]
MLSKYPYLNENYYVHEGPNISAIRSLPDKYDEQLENGFIEAVISNDIVKIIKEFDGKTKLDDVIRILVNKYDEDYNQVKDGIENLINNYICFEIKDEPTKINTLIKNGKDLLYPFKINIDLTDYCNFKCKHCYNESDNKNKIFVDTDNLIDTFKDFNEKGVSVIELMGGEPLAHPNIDKIVDFFCENFDAINIVSNGSLLNQELIKKFKKYSNLSIQITLNSYEKEYHDWFCELDGSHEIVKNNIRLACDNGLNISVSMIITPYNIYEMDNVAKMAYDIGTSNFKVGTILSFGRATEDLICKNNTDIIKRTNEVADKFPKGFIFKEPEHVVDTDVDRINCGAGYFNVGVNVNGDVSFCEVPIQGVSFGNILNDDVDKLFKRLNNRNYHKLQEPNQKLCEDCDYLDECKYCVVQGMKHYFDIGDKCKWGTNAEIQKYISEVKENEILE